MKIMGGKPIGAKHIADMADAQFLKGPLVQVVGSNAATFSAADIKNMPPKAFLQSPLFFF